MKSQWTLCTLKHRYLNVPITLIMLEESNVYFYSTPKKKKGWIIALYMWTKGKTLELDTLGPPFVCFKPTESKSILSGCVHAAVVTFQDPDSGQRDIDCSKLLKNCFLSSSERWLYATTIQSNSFFIKRAGWESPNHNMTEFPCCPKTWESADEVCQRHQGFWFMTLLLTLSKSMVFIN